MKVYILFVYVMLALGVIGLFVRHEQGRDPKVQGPRLQKRIAKLCHKMEMEKAKLSKLPLGPRKP